MNAYITSFGKVLPGTSYCQRRDESYLGLVAGKPSGCVKAFSEGIQFRHYAIDRQQQSLF